MFGKLAHITGKAVGKVKHTFVGASNGNARNNETVMEMKAFKEHVKLLVKEIQECCQKITTTTGTMGKVLAQPLPRAYINSASGTGIELSDPDPKMVGTGVNIEAITAAAIELQGRVSVNVVKPLEAWLLNFSSIKERNHKCEALSQELVAQRRAALVAEETARDHQAKNHKNAAQSAAKATAERDKERKLEEQFVPMEAEIFNDMLACVREIQELRQYALTALQAMQACMTQAVASFDVSKPIPFRLPQPEVLGAGLGAGPSEPGHYIPPQGGAQLPNPFSASMAGGGTTIPPPNYYPPTPGGPHEAPNYPPPYPGPPGPSSAPPPQPPQYPAYGVPAEHNSIYDGRQY